MTDGDERWAHLAHRGRLGLIQEVIQSHEEEPGLHLSTLASRHVTAAATLTALHGAAAEQTLVMSLILYIYIIYIYIIYIYYINIYIYSININIYI